MLRSIASLTILLSAVFTGGADAQDVTRTFNTPTINGVRLDWCKVFGSQCGEPAAELFCQQHGYTRAVQFSIDPGLGATGEPTMVFGDGRLCRAAICSGFQEITCAKPAPVDVKQDDEPEEPAGEQFSDRPGISPGPNMITVPVNRDTTRFRYPHVKNARLDWCRNWGSNCGEPAANLFCQQMGFAGASRFVIDNTTGRKGIPSLVFGDGRMCNARYCNAFKLIACSHRQDPEAVAEPVQPQPDADPLAEESDVDAADVVPVPTRKPAQQPKAGEAAIPVVRPEPAEESENAIAPSGGYEQFEPLAPTVVAVNWVNLLDTISQYPDGASLYKCADGNCSTANDADFEVKPDAKNQTVQLNFRVGDVPHASGALWQASYLPFPPFAQGSEADLSPQGLLDYKIVNVNEGWFSFDLEALADDLPDDTEEAIIHVRVLPVSEAGLEQVVGQPSKTMRIYYGSDMPSQPPYELYAKEKVPDSQPQVRMTKLEFEPFHQVEQWPPGCKAREGNDDEDEEEADEKVGTTLPGAWNWTSKSYQWMQDRVVDIAGTRTLNLLPDSAMEFALNSALVSAGIPPDIPNIYVPMRDGIDGLARGVAKTAVQQVPTADLASNVGNLAADISNETASGMTEEELRDRLQKEIEERSRQALLQAADELEEEFKADGKNALCSTTAFQGVYKVTVENTGDRQYTDLAVRVDAAPVYLEKTWTIDLAPGETMTLVAVAAPKLPNGPYSKTQLQPAKRAEEDTNRWLNETVNDKEVEIEVSLPGALECIGGDPTSQFCQRERFVAHKSPPQLVTEAYEFSR